MALLHPRFADRYYAHNDYLRRQCFEVSAGRVPPHPRLQKVSIDVRNEITRVIAPTFGQIPAQCRYFYPEAETWTLCQRILDLFQVLSANTLFTTGRRYSRNRYKLTLFRNLMMQNHKFRFGITSTGALSADAWKEKVSQIEDLGFSTLLVPDHFIEQIATIPALAVAAAHTSTLRVGSIVCSNDFRHPILLAKEAATIDMLSNGRFELGIGAGWLKSEYDALGMAFDEPGVRVSRLEEAVQVIKAYFEEDPVTYNGEFYQINGVNGLERIPEPIQKPHPPILIGGGGKRMLKIAAREADIIGLAIKTSALGSGPDPKDIATTLQQKIEWIREAAGARFDNLELHIQTWAVMVTDDRAGAAAMIGKQFPLPSELLLNIPYLLIGSIEEIVEQIENYREMFGISYYSVFERHMSEFARVVTRLSGF